MVILVKKISSIFFAVLLLAQTFVLPADTFANFQANAEEDVLGFGEIIAEVDEFVPMYTEADEDSEVIRELADGDVVAIIETLEKFSFVVYEDEQEQLFEGYVDRSFIELATDEQAAEEANGNDAAESETEEELLQQETQADEKEQSDVRQLTTSNLNEQVSYTGIALKNETNIYASRSTSAEVLKTYRAGSILSYRSYNDKWYEATVIVSGVRKTGYIHASHVENAAKVQETFKGVALHKPTHVFARAATDAKALKSYAAGSILTYRTFTKDWYVATVVVKGKRQTGYIHRSHVDNLVDKQVSLKGIALQGKTNVYAKASSDAKVLRSYAAGTVLSYRTFSKNWYEATVILKGKRVTGYIYAADVDNVVDKQVDMRGIAVKSPTHIYAQAATSGKRLKSYSEGTVLKYRTFTENWYEATVIVSGKRQTGYIHRSHVEDVVSKQDDLVGAAMKKPTNVYQKATTKSTVLRKYEYGTFLKFKSFSSKWYEATIYVNGKATSAYIRKADVGVGDYQLEGFAHKNPTNIYAEPKKSADIIHTYDRGQKVVYRAHNKDWYVVSVSIGGKAQTGYVSVNDLHHEMRDLIYSTKYDYDFKEMADRQAKKKPNADGQGKIVASRGLIEFYSNPLNFPKNTDEYYQFLVLSQPAGLNAKLINERILKGKGTLEGTAQAFINAGNKFKINEAYLIAHALHETGNGKSALASGIPVDKDGKVTRDAKGNIAKTKDTKHMTYNMFGYGAINSCPVECGAKYAFDNGWFTIEDSIVGGIESIYSYISRGQDTLYKMRWNPDGGLSPAVIPEWYQYATHIQWATIQTKRIAEIYRMMDDYTLEINVPTFNNTPKQGVTTPASLNIRGGPSTAHDVVVSIPKGTTVDIIGSNVNAWYQVRVNGTTGWASAEYINMVY